MNSNIKTLLIILVFVIITILIFKPFSTTETYNPSIDSKQIESQDKKINTSNAANTANAANTSNVSNTANAANTSNVANTSKNESNSLINVLSSDNRTFTDVLPMDSSFNSTEINMDRMNESNNILRYCTETDNMDDMDSKPSRPYSDIIDEIDEKTMDMDNKQYYDLLADRNNTKTYIQIDDNFGLYDTDSTNIINKDINGLSDINDVLSILKKKSMKSIYSDYKDYNAISGNMKMY